jgi:hypothetical protein
MTDGKSLCLFSSCSSLLVPSKSRMPRDGVPCSSPRVNHLPPGGSVGGGEKKKGRKGGRKGEREGRGALGSLGMI